MTETIDDKPRSNDYSFSGIGNGDIVSESDEDFSKYLLDRMKQLESRNNLLKEQCEQIESDKRYIESQKLKYERETHRLQSEIDRLKSPPLVVASIVDMFDGDKALIRSSTGPQFLVKVSQDLDDGGQLVPGVRVGLNQQTLAVVDIIPESDEPLITAMEVIDSQEVDYSEIGGLDQQIMEISESVELPITKPEVFERIGITPPKGVLLFGPPGTGKTLLAKAVAHRTNATFIRVVGSELVQKYIGDGAKLVRDIFEMARKKAPAIIFIDELDAIAATRLEDTNGADREVQRTLMQLLAEMDGFDNRGDVRIIAATNRADVLDPAIVRPGRLDRIIEIPLPDKDGRETIFRIHTERLNIGSDVDVKKLSDLTEGASGADIGAIVMEAGMLAVRNDSDHIGMSDLLDAVTKVMVPKANNVDHSENMFW
ncbi:proteasome-activating nucleotidase [Methanococcoides alaskense]|uniref:Proteasome-activating nucleotidase n=1 Tax=Methanococcoides alaskense TaxID=325778 RepID=A0AA90TZC0_9EURY|nr:proteasome-activating nucleotidase [Methanococcoides alaskense]MDA0524058.1 proteasome-activating nucleotidase [Methanococcoides alaskense]MDR6222508.1 proteasome regulatory subunit [Methanococcoides alaskense]